ncbi:hypothetical protein K438DRAFT_1777479 [Mycena galopus ATCC 62051]|nr:hypothetical protein K438DRAFT_1777479 [Mycena galopus ATCC 62051]
MEMKVALGAFRMQRYNAYLIAVPNFRGKARNGQPTITLGREQQAALGHFEKEFRQVKKSRKKLVLFGWQFEIPGQVTGSGREMEKASGIHIVPSRDVSGIYILCGQDHGGEVQRIKDKNVASQERSRSQHSSRVGLGYELGTEPTFFTLFMSQRNSEGVNLKCANHKFNESQPHVDWIKSCIRLQMAAPKIRFDADGERNRSARGVLRTLPVWTNPRNVPAVQLSLSSGSCAPPYPLLQYRRLKSTKLIDDDKAWEISHQRQTFWLPILPRRHAQTYLTRLSISRILARPSTSVSIHAKYEYTPKQYGLPTATHCQRGHYLPLHLVCEGAVNTHGPSGTLGYGAGSPHRWMYRDEGRDLALRSPPRTGRYGRGLVCGFRGLRGRAQTRGEEGGRKESTTGIRAADENAGPGASREATRPPDYRAILVITLRRFCLSLPPIPVVFLHRVRAQAKRLTGRTGDQPPGTRIYIYSERDRMRYLRAGAYELGSRRTSATACLLPKGDSYERRDSYIAYPLPVPPPFSPPRRAGGLASLSSPTFRFRRLGVASSSARLFRGALSF